MKADRLPIPVRHHCGQRFSKDRHCRQKTSFIALGILVAMISAVSLANGQETWNLSGWQSEKPPQRSGFDDSVLPIEAIPPTATASGFWRLPPVAETESETPRNDVLEIVQRRDDYAVRRHRRGFFQRFRFSGGWIDRADQNDLGIGNLKTSLTCAVPLGSFENLLIITTGFEATSLRGSSQFDAPSQLYDVGIDFMWRTQLNDRWGAMVAVRPGVASDFQAKQKSFRVTGRALATWRWLPERLSLVFGVVYLDRNDLPILPGAGLVWTPNSLDNTPFQDPGDVHRTTYLAANLIWNPLERVHVGVEYLYGLRENINDAVGTAHRLQTSFIFDLP